MDIRHEIDFGNGFELVHEPENFENVTADIIFTQDAARASFANTTFVFSGVTAKKIYELFLSGVSGGKSITENLPYRITFCGMDRLELMLMTSHSSTKWSCDRIEIVAWKRRGEDWFEQKINSKSFSQAAKDSNIAHLFNFYKKKTPYELSSIPDGIQIAYLTFSEIYLIIQLTDTLHSISDYGRRVVADAAETAVPVVGTAHAPVLVANITGLIIAVAKAVVDIALIAKSTKELVEQFHQRKKYKYCMREKDLWEIICADLGMSLTTDILIGDLENATHMPAKIVMPKRGISVLNNKIDELFDRPANEENNPDSYGYFDGTYSEFISMQKEKYNADIFINNGVNINFVKKNHTVLSSYVMPNTADSNQSTIHLPSPFTTNLSELHPYYRLEFMIDESELNTIHYYRGTSCSVTMESSNFGALSGWGGGKIVTIGQSLAKRKDHLNEIQKVLDAVVEVAHSVASIIILPINLIIEGINAMISVLNILPGVNITPITPIPNPINLAAISQRIGWMLLSNDSFSSPKTFIGVNVGGNWEISQGSEEIMSAKNLMEQFHSIELASRGNQWIKYDRNKFKFCCKDFRKIGGRNLFLNSNSYICRFESLNWNISKDMIEKASVSQRYIYLQNLKEKIIIDGK